MNVPLLFLRKDLRELRRNKYVLPVFGLMPLIAVGVTLLFVLIAPEMAQEARYGADPTMNAIMRRLLANEEFAALPLEQAVTLFFLRSVVGFFLLMPVALSSISAAFSLVGEKQQRTMEPILATPITDRQFLTGKLLASLAPSVAVTWLAAILAIAAANAITWNWYGALLLPDRFWLLGILLFGPLLGAGSVLATMRISAKISDPQTANQFAGLVIVPAFLIGLGLFSQFLTASLAALLSAIILVVALDLLLLKLNLAKFQREEILTKWK